MNRILLRSFLVFFVLSAWAIPALADTDYPCLNACIANGKSSTSCLTQCTHDEKAGQPPVQTDTDYRCVALCKQNGKSSAACLSQCSYDVPKSAALPPPRTTGGASLAAHEMLKAPAPAGDEFVKPHRAALADTPDKNYGCIDQCVQDGMQYPLCNQKCMEVTPEFNQPAANKVSPK